MEPTDAADGRNAKNGENATNIFSGFAGASLVSYSRLVNSLNRFCLVSVELEIDVEDE